VIGAAAFCRARGPQAEWPVDSCQRRNDKCADTVVVDSHLRRNDKCADMAVVDSYLRRNDRRAPEARKEHCACLG
jgi:hypothetical protein